MNSLILKLECLPGTSIDSACHEAMQVANKIGVVVTFDFNGVECMMRPGDSAYLLMDEFKKVLASTRKPKIAVANRDSYASPP